MAHQDIRRHHACRLKCCAKLLSNGPSIPRLWAHLRLPQPGAVVGHDAGELFELWAEGPPGAMSGTVTSFQDYGRPSNHPRGKEEEAVTANLDPERVRSLASCRSAQD
jgi:hypothetical protein